MAFNWNKFPWTNFHDLNLDWIIQTVKTLEDNLTDAIALVQTTVDAAITKLLTGSGDLTISKTGDVRISGSSVMMTGNGGHTQMIGGAVISDGAEQLTMHNSYSNTSMIANYSSGLLTLTNNQNIEAGVSIRSINTPADGGGDNSDFAANVGYVKTAVAAVSEQLTSESEARAAQDEHLQGGINAVLNLVTALQKRAPRVFYFSSTANPGELSSDDVPIFKQALVNRTPIILVASPGSNQYSYYLTWCDTAPTSENINTDSFYIEFRTLDGRYMAHITLVGATGATVVTFDPVS